MNFDNDPPRLSEGEPSELARLVRASRARRPSADATSEMADRLAATSVYAAAARGVSISRHATFAKLAVVALAVVGLGIFTTRTHGVGMRAAANAVDERPPTVAPPSVPRGSEPTDMPSVSVDALPSLAVPVATHNETARAVRTTPSSPAPVATTPSHESEFALVRHAQDALARDPTRALALAQEHARTFPNGELVQEREVIAVEALSKLERRAEAKARANALLSIHPRSPYVARLERAVGEPLATPPSSDSR